MYVYVYYVHSISCMYGWLLTLMYVFMCMISWMIRPPCEITDQLLAVGTQNCFSTLFYTHYTNIKTSAQNALKCTTVRQKIQKFPEEGARISAFPFFSFTTQTLVTIRVVNIWNSLSKSVISADSVDSFKNRLDKFWSNQDTLFDYKVDLTGIGNRSPSNMDDWHRFIFVHGVFLLFYGHRGFGLRLNFCFALRAAFSFVLIAN